jgi:hypothetical protein
VPSFGLGSVSIHSSPCHVHGEEVFGNLGTSRHDINLLGDNIDAIKKNAETLIEASKEVGLEVKAGKIMT